MPSVVESVANVEPLLVLYCQLSAVAEEVAEIVNPLAVIFETEQLTVGALLSIAFRSIDADAVIVPI